LSRSIKDTLNIFEQIKNKNANIISIKENIDTTSAMGRFIFHIFSALNELERELAVERTKHNIEYMKKDMRFVGRIPYGYKLSNGNGSDLIEDEQEQTIITLICNLRDSSINKMSYDSIAQFLNQENISLPRKSQKWHAQTIKRIIERKNNGGPKNINGNKNTDKKDEFQDDSSSSE
jgi:DNA invertase Pin-like site-specific DNA recombinase